MLILSESDIRARLNMRDLIPAMARALEALSAGKVVQPVRSVIQVKDANGYMFSMPAYAGGRLGAKLVTYYPSNRDIETHHAMIVLFAGDTGVPTAVLDGRLITEMRTGAVSAAATDVLARKNVSVLAILGAGAQARSHLQALRLVRAFTDVRVYSPRGGPEFAAAHGVVNAPSAESAVQGADVIVVATSATEPALRGAWVRPGAHICAVGATRPEWREMDDDLMLRAKLFVESRDAANAESGDVRAARAIHAEIGEVFAGSAGGRESDEEITLFKSVGMAVEDIAAAALVVP